MFEEIEVRNLKYLWQKVNIYCCLLLVLTPPCNSFDCNVMLYLIDNPILWECERMQFQSSERLCPVFLMETLIRHSMRPGCLIFEKTSPKVILTTLLLLAATVSAQTCRASNFRCLDPYSCKLWRIVVIRDLVRFVDWGKWGEIGFPPTSTQSFLAASLWKQIQ